MAWSCIVGRSRPTFHLPVGPLFIVLVPLAPIFLIVGSQAGSSTRSRARSTWRRPVTRPFAKNPAPRHHSESAKRNPRRAANVAVIIALGLAFGMFTLVIFSSQLAYQEGQLRPRSAGTSPLRLLLPMRDSQRASGPSRSRWRHGRSRVYAVPADPFPTGMFSSWTGHVSVHNASRTWYFRDFDRGRSSACSRVPTRS